MSKAESITMTVNGTDLVFNVGIEDFNGYQNDCLGQQTGMVDASHNFLVRTVTEETQKGLMEFLNNCPGAAVDITAAVIKEYKKPLKITVGK